MIRSLLTLIMVGAISVVLIIGGFILSRDLFFVTDSYRYRLTLNFEVDKRTESFSGVIQETIHRPPCIIAETNCGRTAIKGDAIPLAFPNGKTAFALLEIVDEHRLAPGELPSRALPRPPTGGGMNVFSNQCFPVAVNLLPDIIFFEDSSDPYSVNFIRPSDMSAIAGETTTFHDAQICVTGDPVTWQIDKYLPWISSFRSNLKPGQVDYFKYTVLENLVSYLRRNDL